MQPDEDQIILAQVKACIVDASHRAEVDFATALGLRPVFAVAADDQLRRSVSDREDRRTRV